MKKLFTLLALGLSLSLGAAQAVNAKTAQQTKMGTCNKEAGDKKGDERKAFMKECLSAKPAAAASAPATAGTPQQEKMKACNAEAKGMKGDERKKKMSECLKK